MYKVTGIEKYKGNTYRVDREDCEPAFLNIEIINEYNLRAGASLPEIAWEEIVYANDFRRARERALYLLDYRDYSYSELFKKLEQNYPEDTCYGVVDKLSELGLIDDRRYAENMARKLMEVKKYGYYRAVSQMREKGLTSEVIKEALEEYDDTTAERLREVIERKYARFLDDEAGIKKTKAALCRLGYSYADIKKALEEFAQEDYDDDEEFDC